MSMAVLSIFFSVITPFEGTEYLKAPQSEMGFLSHQNSPFTSVSSVCTPCSHQSLQSSPLHTESSVTPHIITSKSLVLPLPFYIKVLSLPPSHFPFTSESSTTPQSFQYSLPNHPHSISVAAWQWARGGAGLNGDGLPFSSECHPQWIGVMCFHGVGVQPTCTLETHDAVQKYQMQCATLTTPNGDGTPGSENWSMGIGGRILVFNSVDL